MFDLPETTNVAVGLATKPYPSFRLPGHSRYSVAYHSNGDKSHNYPFTATTFGSSLKEGDVLGVGYRPRTGTVFYTRNGRKTEDAFIGLNTWNLFPTIGADGPCSVHVNLGQSGFVFIEANVKKWGLAPSVGTLAPPPAYGSERGSILLQAGADISPAPSPVGSPAGASTRSRRSHRSRRPRTTLSSSAPVASSPLRRSPMTSPSPPDTPPPPITPIEEEPPELTPTAGPSSASMSRRYVSPTDIPFHTPLNINNLPPSPTQGNEESRDIEGGELSSSGSDSAESSRPPSRATGVAGANPFNTPRRQPFSITHARTASRSSCSGSELAIQVHPPPDSPQTAEPPTPNLRDIHLQALAGGVPQRDPPAYSPLDAFAYVDGVQLDLPAEVIAAALENGTLPSTMITPPPSSSRSDRHRSRRDRR